MAKSRRSKAPSSLMLMAEWRALFEFQSFYAARLFMKNYPGGDGHPVVVLPGFLATDASTKPLRSVLNDLGYDTYGWELGRNLTLNEDREREMHDLVTGIHAQTGRKVSIVGWSLGGVFAREIAKQIPDRVRTVISLGSPIRNDDNYTNARHLFEAINGKPAGDYIERFKRSAEVPPVPCTSIYTKGDGVVAWQASIQPPAPESENIEVPSASHFGLGVNPAVIYAIADRLSQPDGQWQPFQPPSFASVFYRQDADEYAA